MSFLNRLTFGRKSTERIEDEMRNMNKSEKTYNVRNALLTSIKKEEFIQAHHLHQLQHINLQNVVTCLVERYKAGYFYTYAGPMLLSMNPCLPTACRKSVTDIGNASNGDSPSVYSIGEKCLKTLSISKLNSIVVVSGDSGAGKTTATEQLLSYFLCNSKMDGNSLDHKLREAALILESLGNASTISNPNSSRFGRFIQLNYKEGNIIGAEIKTCLLQKHRVSQTNCRNFHIFYYILAGLTENVIPKSLLRTILTAGQLETVLNLVPEHMFNSIQNTDISELDVVLKSFRKLKMMEEFTKVVQIVTGIILLLNTEFSDVHGSLETDFLPTNCDSKDALHIIGNLFSITEDDLQRTLISRTIRAARRGSIIRKRCESLTEVRSRIDSLAITLYNSLFNYILNRLNSELKSPVVKNQLIGGSVDGDDNGNDTSLDFANRISLLDLYGFENLTCNHLEQLCINYANEKLQITTNRIVKNHLGDVEVENIPLSLIQLEEEGRQRIKTIQNDVFSVLNEVCLLNREISDSDIYQRLIKSSRENTYIKAEKLMDRTGSCPFTIRHYATDVSYQMKGMARKNNDTIPLEFAELFATSGDPFIQQLLQYNVPNVKEEDTPRKRRQQRTVLHSFKSQVEGLISALEAPKQEIYFIKCIRPNETLTRGQVSTETVKTQLVSAGIEDILKITSYGLPIRIPRPKFVADFCSIQHRFGSKLEKLFLSLGWNSTDVQCGTTKVLLSENAFDFLQQLEQFIRNKSALHIQRAWTTYYTISQCERAEILKQKNLELERLLHIENETKAVLYLRRSTTTGEISIETESVLYLRRASPDEISILMNDLNLREGDGVLTKGQIHKGPIRFHTRRTPLSCSTNAKKSQGVNEIFEILHGY